MDPGILYDYTVIRSIGGLAYSETVEVANHRYAPEGMIVLSVSAFLIDMTADDSDPTQWIHTPLAVNMANNEHTAYDVYMPPIPADRVVQGDGWAVFARIST